MTEQLSLAAEAKDGKRLCGLFNPRQIEEALGGTSGCVKVLAPAINQAALFENLVIEEIIRTDRGATVKLEGSSPRDISFIKEGDVWYIDTAAGDSPVGPAE